MSVLKMRPKKDAKSVTNPIVGYVEIAINGSPVIRRSVTSPEKENTTIELSQMVSQMWKLFNAAFEAALYFAPEDKNSDVETIVKFTR